MMNRINLIVGFDTFRNQVKDILTLFPALNYLLTLVLTILITFSVSTPWFAFVLFLLLAWTIFRLKPLLFFMLASTIYLWIIKTEINQIRSANYTVEAQEITIRLTDLKIIDPKLLSRRSVSYRADVLDSQVNFPAELMVSFYDPPVLQRGDVLRVKGKLVTSSITIPGNFDYFDYLAKKRIGGIFYAKKVISLTREFDWFSSIEWLRNRVLKTLTKGYDHGSDLWRIVSGVVVGEKRNLTYDDRQRFMTGGIFHIFAVSGMHVALVALLLFYLLGLLQVPYRYKLLISPTVLLIYVLMTGASASSLRAFGMVSIWWIGQFLFRASNLYYLLALCALLQLLFSPLLLYNAGFQFSFVIVFFLIRGMEIKKRIKSFFWIEQNLTVSQPLIFTKKMISIGFDLLYVGVLIFLAVFGLQMYYFKLMQPLTILTAVWSGFCASGIMLFSMLKILLPFEFLNAGIDFFLIPLNSFSAVVYNHEIFKYVGASPFYIVLIYYLILALAFYVRRVWAIVILFLVVWIVMALYADEPVGLYYANIKGSHVVACIDPGRRSAIVYVNGRSTQSALSRLLSGKRIKIVSQLIVGEKYTPTWRTESRFEVKSKKQLLDLIQPLGDMDVKFKIKQDYLIVTTSGDEVYRVSLEELAPNEFFYFQCEVE